MCPLRISVFKFFTQRHWLPPVALSFFTEICVSSIPQSKTIHSSPVFSFTSFRSTSFVFGDNSPGADKQSSRHPLSAPGPAGGVLLSGSLKSSSIVQWNNTANSGSKSALGFAKPFSHLATACWLTLTDSATCCCEKPIFSRNTLMLCISYFPFCFNYFLLCV